MKARICFAAAALFAAGASAQELRDFSFLAPITLEGKGPLHQLTLTPEAYAAIARRDRGDVRVFNGAGELVPYAVVRAAEAQTQDRPLKALPFFALRGAAEPAIGELQVRVDKRRDGSLSAVVSSGPDGAAAKVERGYLIDASALKEAIAGFKFDWPADSADSETAVMVEASDDLSRWRTLLTFAPLLRLRHGDALIEHNKVEFGATRAKYFRVSWVESKPALNIKGVSAAFPLTVKEANRQWTRHSPSESKSGGEYFFEISASAPVDRVRLEVADPYAIVPMTLSIRDREGDKWRSPKSVLVSGFGVLSEQAQRPGHQVHDTARYWMAKSDRRQVGAKIGDVVLHVGWIPDRIIFNARGEGPFTLAAGNRQMSGAALGVETLVPGFGTPQAHKLLPAKVEAVAANPQSTVEHKVNERMGIEDETDVKRFVLWMALVAAVAAIGYMALRLMRQLPAEPPQR